jgi:alpha-mannosidase
MLKHYEITKKRLKQFNTQLRERLYTARTPVALAVHGPTDRIPFAEAMKGEFRPAQVGEKFGPAWSTHWFKVDIDVPAAWRGKEVHLLWDSVSEGQIYVDGQAVQALTGMDYSGRPIRGEWRLLQTDKPFSIVIEMAVNHLFGFNEMGSVQETQFIGWLRQAEIALFDREAWDLLWDYTIIEEMAQHLPADSVRGRQALFTANEMVNCINLDKRDTWAEARKIAKKFLSMKNGDAQHNLSAIGHAHIDTAWLWPLAETRRKVIRTVTNTLTLMNDYPDYTYSFSQAVQHQWVKAMQPALYEQMKARIKEGRIVPVGGMWVEPDTNVPSGESLIRQLIHGQRFFQQEYGITCREMWIPDVFGYCAQLPQISKLGGVKYFLTQKLSWNQINKPQNHTFYWEGLDGTRLLTHFPPADTYNAMMTVEQMLYNVSNYKDLERSNESYALFGFGDGGGGPTMEMLERIARMRDVDGLPKVAMRSSADFFARLEADAKDLNTVVGELYFELHRGTYTTQARTKRNNRKSELLLHDIELIAAAAMAMKKKEPRAKKQDGFTYPAEQLDAMWKTVLLNQFHDIIPGSSIHAVYEDSHAQFAELLPQASMLRDQAVSALESALGNGKKGEENLMVVNTAGFPRSEVVELPAGATDAAQFSASKKPLGIAGVNSMGVRVEDYEVAYARGNEVGPVKARKSDASFTLENDFVRAVFTDDGALVSLFHKGADRESIATGERANQFVLFDDHPMDWEAWDVDVFHLEKRQNAAGAVSAKLIEKGPLRAAIEFVYQLSPQSTLRQVVYLAATTGRLDFATSVDWHESRTFLKVEFPLNVRSQEATYDVQFGHLKRPTHFNTSHDIAMFEVCAHKWADLSENGFGVALMNDCKYGHATHGNVIRLSLLRSPKYPDPVADMGKHEFRYALMPHAGTFQEAGVIESAYAFNMPLIVSETAGAPRDLTLFEVDEPNVMIETVKKAEEGNAVIVRMYEAHGGRGTATLSSDLPVRRAWLCNGLEENEAPLSWKEGVTVDVTPFQIVTVKLEI